MGFSYNDLKNAFENGIKVGGWKNKPVFACPKNELKNKGNGAFFVVFDDNNSIVELRNGTWYKYGEVSIKGMVDEYNKPIFYTEMYEQPHAVCGKPVAACDGTVKEEEEEEAAVIGDVKLGLDVDATLKAARTMTVDSLLEGFNYGLDAKG